MKHVNKYVIDVQALMKADEAKTGAAESSERVRSALNTVDDILNLLSKSRPHSREGGQ